MAKRSRIRKVITHIEGMEEVLKLLTDLGDAAEEVLDSAAKSGAEIVLASAKEKVPVDSGKLRDSLVLKRAKVKNAKVMGVYTISKTGGLEYFAFVELGTSRMKARPYLRPAVDENIKNVADKINEEVLRSLGRIK
ncbi:MAG: hypothetical protein HGA49_00325 [Eubacteriaceae bacterium]|nr:hypothetical protein [Eubacteriaceae bacterium]